jgi:hypothetical protein
MSTLTLLPRPKHLTPAGGTYTLTAHKLITVPNPALYFTATRIQRALAKLGLLWEIVVQSPSLPAAQIGIALRLTDEVTSDKDTYQLLIGADGVRLSAPTEAGLWYAAQTLIQIVANVGAALPCLEIRDWADFARRGVMLDISRDRVPTMPELYALIDKLSSWKINEFQLYTEHTFAYRNHRVVWQNASPMTGEEIMALDRYCRERFIDLVPNQNSFGHMHRWLMHDAYKHMAEVPEGLDWPIFLTPRPFAISPVVPESLKLIEELYAELLPHFSSPYFNVGCDETFDLGWGRSKAAVEQQGRARVYLEFLKQIAGLVRANNRTMQFWGDIVMEHPELVSELPKDLIALEWGYDANHPFDRDGARFAESGVRFYVCPGTSSWISLLGRTENMLANIRNAAENGLKYGAMGMLNTDWGDLGHWQPLPVSYAGFAYGAATSWAYEANKDIDLAAVLDRFAFEDSAGVMGQLALAFGRAHLLANVPNLNSAGPVRALFTPLSRLREGRLNWRKDEVVSYDPNTVRAAMAEAERLAALLPSARPTDERVIADYAYAAGLFVHGCKRLIKAADDAAYSNAALAMEVRGLMSAFSAAWLARSRPGGLGDSLSRMHRMIADYEK